MLHTIYNNEAYNYIVLLILKRSVVLGSVYSFNTLKNCRESKMKWIAMHHSPISCAARNNIHYYMAIKHKLYPFIVWALLNVFKNILNQVYNSITFFLFSKNNCYVPLFPKTPRKPLDLPLTYKTGRNNEFIVQKQYYILFKFSFFNGLNELIAINLAKPLALRTSTKDLNKK